VKLEPSANMILAMLLLTGLMGHKNGCKNRRKLEGGGRI